MTAAADRVAAVLERYEAVIGIEIHCQLRTASKMFCGCSNAYADAAPNTHVCPVCLALPGVAPGDQPPGRRVRHRHGSGHRRRRSPSAPSGSARTTSTRTCRRATRSASTPSRWRPDGRLAIETSAGPFTRPDHPRAPRGGHGEAGPRGRRRTLAGCARASLVDFNRSGAPLMEIVTEPDLRTAEQARRYAEELQMLLRAIGASDADMERGQMRVEANVSLRPRGTDAFGTRVEVKNMNSFRAVERAIAYEIERQGAALDAGEPLHMETRGWDDARQATYRMRAKETSEDYRYFPDPDLPPLHVEPAWIDRVRATLPELPATRRARYEALGITSYDAAVLGGGPRDDGSLRGDLGRRRGVTAGKGGLQLRLGHPCPGREGRRAQSERHCWRLHARGDRRAAGGHRERYRLPPGRPRPPGAASRRRHTRLRAARRRRARSPSRTMPRCWRISMP